MGSGGRGEARGEERVEGTKRAGTARAGTGREGTRRESMGREGDSPINSIYLYILSYTFKYLYIPSNTPHTVIYLYILPYT